VQASASRGLAARASHSAAANPRRSSSYWAPRRSLTRGLQRPRRSLARELKREAVPLRALQGTARAAEALFVGEKATGAAVLFRAGQGEVVHENMQTGGPRPAAANTSAVGDCSYKRVTLCAEKAAVLIRRLQFSDVRTPEIYVFCSSARRGVNWK